MDEFNFFNSSDVIEAFCRAYLETDDLQFVYYAKELMALTIKNNEENTKEK